ncbi:MAG: cysteine--tRNA ligase [Thaumarchaeota archaeon]|nr:cysteine--tRNA ligase [Nitrososphaerota archaeon]
MVLMLYNTLGRRVEEFVPIDEGHVGIYTCGPTVYDYGHIGNFRTFMAQDLLRRYLKFKGYRVTQVMNLTDVDDKTIRGARREGVGLQEYTDRYAEAFFKDLDTLRIERAEQYPRATTHIGEMVRLVKVLLEKGYAYQRGGSVYFDISKFKDYGELSGIKAKKIQSQARVEADEYKEEARDFALWKAWDEEDDGDVFWETEIGKGRPGWHIECSAMSIRYLGETFDIHSGGIDLIFPHHENEIAQTEAATGKKFVNHWIHVEHLMIEGQKMSKSLGNILTVRDILSKGYSGRTIRYLLLTAHYRTQLNFTEAGLKQAEASLKRLDDFLHRLKTVEPAASSNPDVHGRCAEVLRRFEEAMDNDLGIPEALAAVFDFIRETNRLIDSMGASEKDLQEIRDVMLRLDTVLGVLETEAEELPEDLRRLIEEREEARKRRDWARADKIRAELLAQGVVLEDTPEGATWKIIKKQSV